MNTVLTTIYIISTVVLGMAMYTNSNSKSSKETRRTIGDGDYTLAAIFISLIPGINTIILITMLIGLLFSLNDYKKYEHLKVGDKIWKPDHWRRSDMYSEYVISEIIGSGRNKKFKTSDSPFISSPVVLTWRDIEDEFIITNPWHKL